MRAQPHDWNWWDASDTLTDSELSRACGMSVRELDELVDYGALKPLAKQSERRVFSASCVPTLRTACEIRRDYDLDLFTVALLMGYLIRIEELEHEIRALHSHLPAHVTEHRDGPQPWREGHAKAN